MLILLRTPAHRAQAGVTINLLIEIDAGQARCGLSTNSAGISAITQLAKAIAAAGGGVALKGIHCYNGLAQHVRCPRERRALISERVVPAAEAGIAALRAAGAWRDGMTVTGGGTGTYEFEAESGVFNEVPPHAQRARAHARIRARTQTK